MTIEELESIVVETVKKYILLDRQKVLALCFDETNKAELLEAARSINGRADYVPCGDIERAGEDYDVMFVDYIRFPDVAEAALGLAFSPWGRLVGSMIVRGKPVFQLKKTPGSGQLSPACRAVLKGYWKQLYSLGVTLLDSGVSSDGGVQGEVKKEALYNGNVLSRRDIFAFPNADRIVIGREVLVTALAADEAQARNMEIVRRE
jgi:hypothetical protein